MAESKCQNEEENEKSLRNMRKADKCFLDPGSNVFLTSNGYFLLNKLCVIKGSPANASSHRPWCTVTLN